MTTSTAHSRKGRLWKDDDVDEFIPKVVQNQTIVVELLSDTAADRKVATKRLAILKMENNSDAHLQDTKALGDADELRRLKIDAQLDKNNDFDFPL